MTRLLAAALLLPVLSVVGCTSSGDDTTETGTGTDTPADGEGTAATTTAAVPAPNPGQPDQDTPGGTVPTDYQDPTATTVVVSPHDQCFDLYLEDIPSGQHYFAQDTDTERTVELNHSPMVNGGDPNPHALFVLEDGRAVGAILFDISAQDVITVNEVRDGDCEELTWDHTGSEIETTESGNRHTYTTLVASFGPSAYEVVIDIEAVVAGGAAGGQVIRTEYTTTLHAVE